MCVLAAAAHGSSGTNEVISPDRRPAAIDAGLWPIDNREIFKHNMAHDMAHSPRLCSRPITALALAHDTRS